MNPNWQSFLASQGAVIENDVVSHFGASPTLASLDENTTYLCDLSGFGLIHFTGDDTATFLHGQLSSDINNLSPDANQYSSQSTPKGRVLANFLVWRQQDGYMLQLSADLTAGTQKRLSMYILRSKSKATDLPASLVMLGLTGPQAAELIASLTNGQTMQEHSTLHHDGLTILRTTANRYQLVVNAEQAPALWDALAKTATPAGFATWQLSEITHGTPWITTPTQDAFVAQMLNLDKLAGGISFTKGCYTGQEIIARTQYLGKLKRRTYRLHADQAMQAGDSVFSPEMHGQASGTVVNAVQTATGWEALAVVQSSSVPLGLHLADANGPVVSVLDLPYSLETAA